MQLFEPLFSNWVFLVLAATLIWAGVNIIDKYTVSKKISSWQVASALSGFAGIISIVLTLALAPISIPSAYSLALLVAYGLLWTGAIWLYYIALKEEEVSRVISIFLLDPIFTAVLAAVFLNEIFGPVQYFGIVLVVAGAMIVSVKDFKAPKFGKGFWYALASTAIFAVVAVLLKLALQDGADYVSAFFWGRVGLVLGTLPMMFLYRKQFSAALFSAGKTVPLFVFGGVVSSLAALFFTRSVQIGFVTLVSAIASLQPLFVLAFALVLSVFKPHILREEIGRGTIAVKLAAIVAMIVGSYLAVA